MSASRIYSNALFNNEVTKFSLFSLSFFFVSLAYVPLWQFDVLDPLTILNVIES